MGSSVHHGLASFAVNGVPVAENIGNRTHPFNDQQVFEAFVRTGRWANYSFFGMRVQFRRHSPTRPYVQNLRHRGARLDFGGSYTRGWENAIDYNGGLGNGPEGTAGSTLTNRSDSPNHMCRDFGRNYQLGNYPAAIGSMCVGIDFYTAGMLSYGPANSQSSSWGQQAISEVDLPQNTIGNVFKHPVGSGGAWFNVVGQVPLSQGQVLISGVYNPPERQLHHAGYQIYYAKNGGTGVVQGAVKSDGSTSSATPARFTDTVFAGFTSGDVGKYIAVHGRGIYLITAFVDASNVDTDAVSINESFSNDSGLTWTLRTGPIAEYFWRRRPYFKLSDWVNYISNAYSALEFSGIDEILQSNSRSDTNCTPQRVVYDGHGHWWWTTPNRPAAWKQYSLMRHLHMSPQPMQAVYADGSLTGLSNWGGNTAGGYYDDIIVDQNRRLWMSAYSPGSSFNVLCRIHPAPGGDASAPAVEALWRKQQAPADASGLTSRHVIALCDDRSGVYSGGAGSHRIWALSGASDTEHGGLNYSDDDGTTWSRVHGLPATLAGTCTANSGSATVTGSSTLFLTGYVAGDWIRFGVDDRAYQVLSIASNTSLTLSVAYGGVSGSGKAHAKVQSGDVSLTNGSGAVSAVGGSFTTQLAVGDWVRFGDDARSYRVTAIAGNNGLTISPAYLGLTRSQACVRRGGLERNEAFSRTGYNFSNSDSGYHDGQHNVDWDTNGNVYWLSNNGSFGSQETRICRWSETDGACTSFNQTSIPGAGPLTAVTSGTPVNFLKVVRVPQAAGAGTHPFHNEVWLGFSLSSGDDLDTGGWVRVRGDVAWTSSPTAANFTRYHYNQSITTSFPSIVRVPKDGASDYRPRSTSIFVDPGTGNIGLYSAYGEFGDTQGWHWLYMSGTETGIEYWRPTQNMNYSPTRASSNIEPWRRSGWDEEGMGLGCVVSGQEADVQMTESEPPMTMHASVWQDRRWSGSAWLSGIICGSVHYDLNFRGGSNVRTAGAVLGAGLRRAHEWNEPLDYGMYIAFQQAGGATAQSDEFIADETTTFVCSIGSLKDNTQTCNVYYQYYVQPTVYRVNDEAVKTIRNQQSVDYGVDGGYTSIVAPSRIPFNRGVALGHKYPAGYGNNNMLSTNNQAVNVSSANQATICIRVPDLVELDADGSWSSGTDLFNTAGGYVFTAADVGKSIFIEGANGAVADVDNGQAVILAVNSATQVQVDKVFATTRSAAVGRRWKLKDVPAVSFVEAGTYNTYNTHWRVYWTHRLWSSKDFGQTWNDVKFSNESSPTIPLNGPDDASAGVWFSSENGYRGQTLTSHTDYNPQTGNSIIFDLRGLPENTRRRMHWRWRVHDVDNNAGQTTSFADVFLYDENFKMIGRPPANKIDDADDDQYMATHMFKAGNIRASGIGASPVDDGNADGLTNIVNVTGPLYTDTGVNDAQVTSAGRFIDPGAAFTRLSVGNYIRVSGAANAANNGWALITGYVSATEVQTSKAFVNETNTFTWATCPFGPNDELRIDNAQAMNNRGTRLDDAYFTIVDVPSTSQITVQQADVPHPLSSSPWSVSRDLNLYGAHPSAAADLDVNSRLAYCLIAGSMYFGRDLEFVTVQESLNLASTPADDDGDGMTDQIIVGDALTTNDGPVAGDVIEISHVTYGRRLFEILSITGSNPNKVIRVKYDEILPSLIDISWKIFRRRDLQFQVQRMTVVGKGVAPT